MRSNAGRVAILVVLVAAAVVLFVALQGSDDDSGDDTTTSSSEATTQTAPAEPAPELIELRGGAPVGGVKKLTYSRGDQVRITVQLDEPQEDVHIHGYDLEVLNPASAAEFDFRADVEGIFELEAHGPSGDVVLAEIRVEPA
jgi:hypothetical protein